MGHQGLPRARLAGLARQRRLRPARGRVAAALGASLRRLRRRARSAPGCAGSGVRVLPSPGLGRARRLATPTGHGNSVPRFHITWGTGPGLLEPFVRRVREGQARGLVTFAFRHRVDELVVYRWRRRPACAAPVLAPSAVARGEDSSREVVGDFEASAQAVLVTSGGIGAQLRPRARELARAARPAAEATDLRASRPTSTGACWGSPSDAGGQPDRPRPHVALRRGHPQLEPDLEPPRHPDPARARRRCGSTRPGKRLPVPLFPGFDTLATLEHIGTTGYDYTWFVLTRKIIEREFALSGSEQNPDITGKNIREVHPPARAAGRARPDPDVHGPRRRTSSSSATSARSCAA